MPIDIYCCKVRVGVFDTLYDSIQCLNFANVALPEKDSADSIQKIVQFNSQRIIDTG